MILRRTATPYVGQSVVLLGTTFLAVSVALTKQQWGLLWGVALIWGLYGSWVLLFGLRYNVSWDDKAVVMKASGGPERRIGFEEIRQVRYETADASEFLSQARPFRRIVIIGSNSHDPNGLIDVSLRHFKSADIDRLLAEIHDRRPDVQIPVIHWPRRSDPSR